MIKRESKSKINLLCGPIGLMCLIFIILLVGNLSAQEPKPERAYRLTVKYQNGSMDLLIVDTLFMVIPIVVKEQIMREEDYPTGYFFEMLDENNRSVLRANMHDPTVTLLEYEDPAIPGQIKSKLVQHDEMIFSIIVPAPTEARSIRFSRVAPDQDRIPVEERRHETLGTFELIPD